MIAISDKRAVDASASTDPLRYANHSCAPNLVLKVQQGRVAFYAIHDIAAGEELTAATAKPTMPGAWCVAAVPLIAVGDSERQGTTLVSVLSVPPYGDASSEPGFSLGRPLAKTLCLITPIAFDTHLVTRK